MKGRPRPPTLARGERLLAWATTPDDGTVGGSRDALHLPGSSGREPVRLPWEAIATAEWDTDERLLRVVEVGSYGEVRPEHTLALVEADRLLALIRERVTASIVVQRHVPVRGRLGARVIGRRAPAGRGPIAWFVDYDPGLDPADPEVAAVVEEALTLARGDVGE